MQTEPRHLHVPAGRAARGGRHAERRAGALHQPLVPAQLRGRDRGGGPPPAHHHLRAAPHRARRGARLRLQVRHRGRRAQDHVHVRRALLPQVDELTLCLVYRTVPYHRLIC